MEYDRMYLYNHGDIFSQLRDFSKQQYRVHEPVNISNIEIAIDEMCNKTAFDNSLSSIVLAINICSEKSMCNHCPQWVGLVIICENNTYKAFYVDTLNEYKCDPDFNIELLKRILKRKGINIIHFYYQPSNIFNDCGPLTVINLDKLARTRSFLEKISEEDIINVREKLTKLRETYSLLEHSTCNFDISRELIREIKEINPDKSKKWDIKIIMEALKLIENITDIKNTLRQIGHLFGEITRDDNDKNNIRNKYNFNENFNNGIPFDHFYDLKNYFDVENNFQTISQDDMEILKSYLTILKGKLMDILKNQRDFVDNQQFLYQIDLVSEDNQDDSTFFVVTVEKYLKLQIRFDIDRVIDSLNGLNTEYAEDKYKFARLFTILGELANKLEKSLTNQKIINTKHLYSIRNKIIHYHKRIIHEPLNNDLIISVIHDFLHNSENDESELLENRKKLLQHLKYQLQSAKEESKPKNNENIKYNLDVLIFQAAKICKGISNYSNKEKGLNNLNENYQSQFSSLNEVDKNCYPEALHLKYEDQICKHSKHNVPIPSQERFFLEIKQLNGKKTINKNLFKCKMSDINKQCNYLIKVIAGKSIDNINQRYIISHSIMIIMQYVRDLSKMDNYNDIKSCSDQIDVTLNEIFRKCLQIEFLDEENSIHYLYTSSNSKYCPIIALVYCNIGVSLAKLSLHDQSIDYLSKASEFIDDFNNIIFSNNLTIHKNEVENELYQFSINRIYAKVLHLAKRFEISFQEFEKINKKIQLENINKYSDINFKNEIIQFYLDFSLLLIDQKKFDDANEICKEALKLDSDNVAIKLRLSESHCKNEKFKDADVLFNNLMDDSQDDGEKCNILIKFVIFCLLCSNVRNGVNKAKDYLDKMKNIISNKHGSFYHVYYQKFIQLNLEVLRVKSTMDQCIEDITLLNLELEFKELIKEMKLKNQTIIIWVYLCFCLIHSNYAKITGDHKHINEAKKYCKIASEMISENLRIDINQIYMGTVIKFLEVYIDYSIDKSDEINLEILEEHLFFGIDLQKKSNIQNSLILQRLIKLFDIVIEKYINNNTGNGDLKQCLLLIDKKFIFVKYLKEDSNYIFKYLEQKVSCCSKLADLFDMKFMKEAVFYYENILLHMVPVNEVMEYFNKKEYYEKQINLYRTLLENILNDNFDFRVNQDFQQIIDYFNRTFHLILEIVDGKLKLRNIDSISDEDLKRIKEEKEYFDKPLN